LTETIATAAACPWRLTVVISRQCKAGSTLCALRHEKPCYSTSPVLF
jgi:hypothetical protein